MEMGDATSIVNPLTLRQRVVTLENLTAAHYHAYSWVLSNLPPEKPTGWALDFGCRISVLPALLVEAGYKVVAIDRARGVVEEQAGTARALGVPFSWDVAQFEWSAGRKFPAIASGFAVATAVWAVQHNFPAQAQTDLAVELARLVAPGGLLLVVSSHSSRESREDWNRRDPQIILSGPDHAAVILEPLEKAGMRAETVDHFRYEHGTVEGCWCGPGAANAICYKLKKTMEQ